MRNGALVAEKAEFGMCRIHSEMPLRLAANRKEKKKSSTFTLDGQKLICPECLAQRDPNKVPLGMAVPPLWQ